MMPKISAKFQGTIDCKL